MSEVREQEYRSMRQNVINMLESIRLSFPHLKMELDLEPKKPVNLLMDIFKQDGLNFDMHLYLADDALHLVIGNFWSEWFPCTDQENINNFRETVNGVIKGTYRIADTYRGDKCLKSEIQRPEENTWKTVSSSVHLMLFAPWWKPATVSIIQNKD